MMLHHCGRNRPSRDIRFGSQSTTTRELANMLRFSLWLSFCAFVPLIQCMWLWQIRLEYTSEDTKYWLFAISLMWILWHRRRHRRRRPFSFRSTKFPFCWHSLGPFSKTDWHIFRSPSSSTTHPFNYPWRYSATSRQFAQKKSVHRGALSRDISHPFGKPFIYLLPCRGITENIPLFLQWLSVCGHLRGGVQLRKLQKGTAATANSDRGHEAVVQKEHRSANSNRIIRFCRTFPWPIAGN